MGGRRRQEKRTIRVFLSPDKEYKSETEGGGGEGPRKKMTKISFYGVD